MLGFLNRSRRENRERLLFSYPRDGVTKRADPLKVDAELERHGGREWGDDLDTVAKLHQPLSEWAAGALTKDQLDQRRASFAASLAKLVALARTVFDLPEIDPDTGRGVSGAEALAVLVSYVEWSRSVAEDVRPLA